MAAPALVLTFVGQTTLSTLSAIDKAKTALLDAGATVGDVKGLSNLAFDIFFTGIDEQSAEQAVRAALPDTDSDLLAQDADPAKRKKQILIADMDSTMITAECLDELADFAGLKAEIVEITERAMRGELDFEEALDARIGMLAAKGLGQESLDACYQDRITLSEGARTAVRTMAENGAHTALVSGGFTFFTERVAEALGMAENRANILQFDDAGQLKSVARPILGKEAKQAALEEMSKTHNTPLSQAIAIGDGANDLAMIGIAGLGVAYRAKPVVAEAARARIDHTPLTTLLYFQGYSADQFVID